MPNNSDVPAPPAGPRWDSTPAGRPFSHRNNLGDRALLMYLILTLCEFSRQMLPVFKCYLYNAVRSDSLGATLLETRAARTHRSATAALRGSLGRRLVANDGCIAIVPSRVVFG